METKTKLALCVGTRPEILMSIPLMEELKKMKFILIHSGQHYDFLMSKVFFQLSIRNPDVFLNCKKSGEFERLSEMVMKYYDALKKNKPTATIVFGDTNSAFAAAYASIRAKIPVIHLESGTRMNDLDRAEEINRILIDHISQILFCDGKEDKQNLLKEGVKSNRIFTVGSIKFDIVDKFKKRIDDKIFDLYKIKKTNNKVILVTLHRQENVDNTKRLKLVVEVLDELGKNNIILFPLHPRTEKRMKEFGLLGKIKKVRNLHIMKPLNYLDFISFVSKSDLVITDSGGVPRETLYFGIPTIMFHKNFFMKQVWRKPLFISGYKKEDLLKLSKKLLKMQRKKYGNPYGDGQSSKKMVNIILKNRRLLKIPSESHLVL